LLEYFLGQSSENAQGAGKNHKDCTRWWGAARGNRQ
jgi:hypothetical protein